MGTKFSIKAFTWAFLLVIMNFGCGKDCSQNIYSFEINSTVYPSLDSITINDTIWLEISSGIELIDQRTGKLIRSDNAVNLGSTLSFGEFTGGSVLDPGIKGAVSSFDYHLITGEQVSSMLPDQVKEYKCKELQGKYLLKLGIIPKRKGIFSIAIGNAANVFRANDKCTKASFSIKLKNTDNHLYLLEQNRPGYTPSGLELTNLYCFKVH